MKGHSKILSLLLALLAVTGVLTSCQNNGHIGNLFGTWALREMSVDNVPDAAFDPETTAWSFQNDIINISLLGEHHSKTTRMGTWTRVEDEGSEWLLLDYTHKADGIEAGTMIYRAPEWLGWPENSVIRLRYLEDSSRKMILEWQNPDNGKTYTYTLRKTW